MRISSLLKQAPDHEDAWGSLGTRRKLVSSGKWTRYPPNLRAGAEAAEKRTSAPCLESNPYSWVVEPVASHYTDCVDPHFLDLDTSWRWEVRGELHAGPLYRRGKAPPGNRWVGGWVGPRLELRPLNRRARSQSLSRLHEKCVEHE
jgi:hypothetical protein